MAAPLSKTTSKYLTGSLWHHVIASTLAGSVGLLALFASDFVDIYFIGLMGVPYLAAAVGYAATITFFTTSLAIGLAIGAGVLVGKNLGARQTEAARRIALSSLVIAAGTAVCLSLLLATVAPWLIQGLGAQGDVAKWSISFLRVLVVGLPGICTAVVSSALLRAQGAQGLAARVTLVGAIINVVMDPILMFGFGMGFLGAAWATVLSQYAMLAVALYTLSRSNVPLQFPKGHERWRALRTQVREDLKPLSAFALPAIAANLSTPVGNAYLTQVMSQFGTDAVAGFAVIGRLVPIAFAFVFAMSGAIGPIIAQNVGAKRFDRIRSALKASYHFSLIYVVLTSLLLWAAQPLVLRLFPLGPEGQKLVVLFCGPLALFWVFNAWLFCANAAFNNLSRPIYSTVLNWARQTIFTIPFTWVATHYWQAAGVLIGPAVGGALLGTVAMMLSFRLTDQMARAAQT